MLIRGTIEYRDYIVDYSYTCERVGKKGVLALILIMKVDEFWQRTYVKESTLLAVDKDGIRAKCDKEIWAIQLDKQIQVVKRKLGGITW